MSVPSETSSPSWPATKTTPPSAGASPGAAEVAQVASTGVFHHNDELDDTLTQLANCARSLAIRRLSPPRRAGPADYLPTRGDWILSKTAEKAGVTTTYQPANHYRPLQIIEFVIYAAATLAFVTLTVRRINRST